MNIEGVWKLEMMALHGWEHLATAFLQDGRYLSASADHYTIGKYQVDGDTFMVQTSVTQHGKIRTLFGSKKKHLTTILKGKIKKDGRIAGTISPTDGEKYTINMRLTRLGDLD